MTRVVYAARARSDLLRLTDFLLADQPESARETATLIIDAISVLERHPLIGRAVSGSTMRELVISRGRSGYLALYAYESATDVVIVHAVRHQREAGFEE